MMKINQTPTKTLKEKRLEMLRNEPTQFTIQDDKKVLTRAGKGCEAASLYFRHIEEELHRRKEA